jgi:hypothetical protein
VTTKRGAKLLLVTGFLLSILIGVVCLVLFAFFFLWNFCLCLPAIIFPIIWFLVIWFATPGKIMDDALEELTI